MPLVDYGSSGESSEEENDQEDQCEVPSGGCSSKQDAQVTDDSGSETNLLSSLPKPKGQVLLGEKVDQLKNLLLKDPKWEDKKGPAKIAIPSLSEFENDDEEQKPKQKKVKTSANNTGLFSVLPPPKNVFVKESNRTLLPHVLKNQLLKKKMDNISSVDVNLKKGGNSNNTHNDSDDDNDSETASTSYFGEGVSNSDQKLGSNYSDPNYVMPASVENIPVPPNQIQQGTNMVNFPEPYNNSLAPDFEPGVEYQDLQGNNETLELDDKAMQILCGGKRKRNQMPVNIIDLSGEEIMPDSKEWLLKQLTEEKSQKIHSHKKTNGPSVQSRRKHQITYLAFQAKAQELELQNQWSQNRMSRRQTQQKYGF